MGPRARASAGGERDGPGNAVGVCFPTKKKKKISAANLSGQGGGRAQ